MTTLYITSPAIKNPHRFPLGYTRTINGERCTLYAYTSAGHPRYKRPNGKTYTLLPRKIVKQKAELHSRVMVNLPKRKLTGIVVKRSPLRIRITDWDSELYGMILEKPKYRAVEKG